MEQDGSEQEQKPHIDGTDTREDTQQNQDQVKTYEPNHEKPKKWFEWRNILVNAAVAGLLFFAGYCWQVKPQLDLATRNLALQTPAEVILRNQPHVNGLLNGLAVVNLGEAIVENVKLRFGLFLVSDSLIYTCHGLDDEGFAYFLDSTRTPREKLWPRLSLKPNEEMDMSSRVYGTFMFMYAGENAAEPSNEGIVNRDMLSLAQHYRGRYVLLAEMSFRRSIDYTLEVDTSYFWYDPVQGPYGEIASSVGGANLIRRLVDYIRNGPEMFMRIRQDMYVVWTHSLVDWKMTKIVAAFPRRVQEDSVNTPPR